MKCKYCKSKCEPNIWGHSSESNQWDCERCYGGISIHYKTEVRDDDPIEITLIIPYQDKTYHVILDLIKKCTHIKTRDQSELLANFNYIMKITPKIAEDKLKTVLTFG